MEILQTSPRDYADEVKRNYYHQRIDEYTVGRFRDFGERKILSLTIFEGHCLARKEGSEEGVLFIKRRDAEPFVAFIARILKNAYFSGTSIKCVSLFVPDPVYISLISNGFLSKLVCDLNLDSFGRAS